MRKSWQVFHNRLLLLRYFWCFVLQVLEYRSAVRCSAVDSHLKRLDRVVRGARFLAGGLLDSNLAHWRSVAVLCVLFKINNNMHNVPPLPYVPSRVTRCALVVHRHSFAPPRHRTFMYLRTFVPLSVFLWNDIAKFMHDGVEQAGFKSIDNAFLLAYSALSFCLLLFSILLPSMGWVWEVGVFVLIEGFHSLPA